jgi:hypothetical protein
VEVKRQLSSLGANKPRHLVTSRATLVLSNHRPETVPLAKPLMACHDAVILEESPEPHFEQMLSGRLGIHAYLEGLDLEYPEFGQRMCETLRELHSAGKRLYQVEPFLEKLVQIHELLANGGRPAHLETGTDLHEVYVAEREATAALIHFYEVSLRGTFEETVSAVKQFARADARRFAVRDRMRADAIVAVLPGEERCYIEAGQIHYPLWRDLKQRLPADYALTVKFLMADTVREMGHRGHLYGPGDLLTLFYRFHPSRSSRKEDLLAARALIYNKLIAKEEIVGGMESYPHTRNELEVIATVRHLSLAECRYLYPLIRRASTKTAQDMVRHYLSHQGRSG